jgi:hypothetical protein
MQRVWRFGLIESRMRPGGAMSKKIEIFSAKKIITIDPVRPLASHVAVRDGRILGVGDLEDLTGWGAYTLNEQFKDKVLTPGFVEGHSHLMDGGTWAFTYTGFFDRTDPEGRVWQGLKSIDEVIDRLREAEAKLKDPEETLHAWGFDPIYFRSARMTVKDLDRVSSTRPIVVMHASGHLLNANTEVLRRAEISRDTNVEGVLMGGDGAPTGELQEMAAMYMAFRVAGAGHFATTNAPETAMRFAKLAQLAGVTTATDLYAVLTDNVLDVYEGAAAREDFPIRLVVAMGGADGSADEGIARHRAIQARNTDKLRFHLVKLMTDGSIQGFTARVKWPGYYNGKANGIWNMSPADIEEKVAAYHKAGIQMHIHTNGDEASEVTIDALERAIAVHPWPDHRHTLQHCQMADAAQFRRLGNLGGCANLFCNHLFYWGDEHHDLTIGPDRAHHMDATRTALENGVSIAMHSDAPITPIGPLFTAWCAVNRTTASGRVLGPGECLSIEEALRAITLGAAYTLHMDHEIGSIERGKWADFAVLEDDPLTIAPEKLKDVGVWGTVMGGCVFEAPRG